MQELGEKGQKLDTRKENTYGLDASFIKKLRLPSMNTALTPEPLGSSYRMFCAAA